MLELAHIIKYLVEGIGVSVVAYYITGKKTNFSELFIIGVMSAITFMILDIFAPAVGSATRQGAGFGIGLNMVGGNPTPMPWRWYNPENPEMSGGGNMPWKWYNPESMRKEGFTVQDQGQSQGEFVPVPYKLIDGQYSAKVLLPGYNEDVDAFNDEDPTKLYSSVPGAWSNITHQTGGGGGSGEIMKIDEPEYRRAGALYSGDIINVSASGAGTFLQRGVVDSQIIFDKPLPKIGTNISKLRFVNAETGAHNAGKQNQINYGTPVYLMHNAYFNNKNEERYIKYGDRLQSHQEGPLFRVFKIYDPTNLNRTGPVEPDQDIILARGDVKGDNIYLKLESDKSVSSTATEKEASHFKISLVRVFELHNKNLCVCPGEVLYP